VAVVYELAGAMARRGNDVRIFHGGFFEGDVRGLDDIDWFEFDPRVSHVFAPDGAPDDVIPDADVLFGFAPDRADLTRIGLPVVLMQGYGMLGRELERAAFRSPCPKVCVSGWLLDVARRFGVDDRELVQIPVGLRTEKYRLLQPIDRRAPRIVYCYSSHAQKGPDLALDVLAAVRRQVPEIEVTMFGARAPEHRVPDWITYRTNPPQRELVEEIYNQSRILLCTSEVEGFGLFCVEAMACGAALVTTDNGGSRDYAFDGRTALVADRGDRDGLADRVVSLLRDDARRVALAEAGRDYVQRFRWDRSAEMLEEFLVRYVADPAAFGYREPS
jgi:glycosyltransferase involved in cell wall biosynthesis